jgi:hypothetical protein
VLMELTSFGDVEYGPAGQFGQRVAIGRLWSFRGSDDLGAFDLFVETPGALQIPRVGSVYQIILRPEKSDSVKLAFVGHDRNNDRWYRIMPYLGGG